MVSSASVNSRVASPSRTGVNANSRTDARRNSPSSSTNSALPKGNGLPISATGIHPSSASPFALLDWTSRQYFQPGVPWIAFLLIVLWSAIEATIFTFTLKPTLSELLADIAGYELNATALSVLLFLTVVLNAVGLIKLFRVDLSQARGER